MSSTDIVNSVAQEIGRSTYKTRLERIALIDRAEDLIEILSPPAYGDFYYGYVSHTENGRVEIMRSDGKREFVYGDDSKNLKRHQIVKVILDGTTRSVIGFSSRYNTETKSVELYEDSDTGKQLPTEDVGPNEDGISFDELPRDQEGKYIKYNNRMLDSNGSHLVSAHADKIGVYIPK